MMVRIAINYRRDDTSPWAGRLYDRLSQEFGREHVFMDIDTLEPGVDFVDEIKKAVSESSVLVAVIGPDWLSISDQKGNRRLDNPMDFVRLEIAAALERSIRIVPVLVGGAVMPSPDELPKDLAALARRNALEISDLRFHSDVDRLIRSIKLVLDQAGAQEVARPQGRAGKPTHIVPTSHRVEKPSSASPTAAIPPPRNPTPEHAAAPSPAAKLVDDRSKVPPTERPPPQRDAPLKHRATATVPYSALGKAREPSMLRDLIGVGNGWSVHWGQCLIVTIALVLSSLARDTLVGSDVLGIFVGAGLTLHEFLPILAWNASLVLLGVLCFSRFKSEGRGIMAVGLIYGVLRTASVIISYDIMDIVFTVRWAIVNGLWPILLFGALSSVVKKFRALSLGIFVAVSSALALSWLTEVLILECCLSVTHLIVIASQTSIIGAGLWVGHKFSKRGETIRQNRSGSVFGEPLI